VNVPIASTSAGSVVSGTLVEIDPPLDQAEVEHDYRRGVPLREILDSPPSTVAESFFEGPVVTQAERDEADRRWEEEEDMLGEVFNQDADALCGGVV